MKKHLLHLILLLGILSPIGAFAQRLEDVVHLNNGSEIRGVIVEQIPNESIKIQTRDGNILSYTMGEIERLTKERGRRRSPVARERRSFNNPRGYMGMVEVGGGIGVGDFPATRISASMINGYRFSPHFAVGVGVGIEVYLKTWRLYNGGNNDIYENGGDFSVPVFLHLRSDFLKGSWSPFVSCNIGYDIPLKGYYNGPMFDSSAGIGFNIGSEHRMTVGFGYALNQVKYAFGDQYQGYVSGKDVSDSFKLKIGFSF